MNLSRLITRIFALAGNGELDPLLPQVGLLTHTLSRYPSRRPLESEQDLEGFLEDDETIRVTLAKLMELIADLDLPLESAGSGVADLAANCADGLTEWFADLRRLQATHPKWKEELAVHAHLQSLATLEKLAATPPAAPGAGEKPNRLPPASPASGTAVFCTACGGPATEHWHDMDVCASCHAQAEEYIASRAGDAS